MTTPGTLELDELRRQNALLLRRLIAISRERDELLKRIAALTSPQETEAEASA
jgi:hypothetical protein